MATADTQYRTDLNMGLPSTFQIQNGAFQLIGGPLKAQDNMRVFMSYSGWFREYFEDFCVDIGWLVQKPTSSIQMYKSLILGRFIQSAQSYMPFIKVVKMNTFYDYNSRREFSVGIEYMYNIATTLTLQYVKYINGY